MYKALRSARLSKVKRNENVNENNNVVYVVIRREWIEGPCHAFDQSDVERCENRFEMRKRENGGGLNWKLDLRSSEKKKKVSSPANIEKRMTCWEVSRDPGKSSRDQLQVKATLFSR